MRLQSYNGLCRKIDNSIDISICISQIRRYLRFRSSVSVAVFSNGILIIIPLINVSIKIAISLSVSKIFVKIVNCLKNIKSSNAKFLHYRLLDFLLVFCIRVLIKVTLNLSLYKISLSLLVSEIFAKQVKRCHRKNHAKTLLDR